jgi:hypothetical protein
VPTTLPVATTSARHSVCLRTLPFLCSHRPALFHISFSPLPRSEFNPSALPTILPTPSSGPSRILFWYFRAHFDAVNRSHTPLPTLYAANHNCTNSFAVKPKVSCRDFQVVTYKPSSLPGALDYHAQHMCGLQRNVTNSRQHRFDRVESSQDAHTVTILHHWRMLKIMPSSLSWNSIHMTIVLPQQLDADHSDLLSSYDWSESVPSSASSATCHRSRSPLQWQPSVSERMMVLLRGPGDVLFTARSMGIRSATAVLPGLTSVTLHYAHDDRSVP